ncbi:lysophospholipid acyltransferase family protein [Acanthopleuribacter pedis]|uniref:1-acyl-sn-glycerol-3-phosphate acyltransferase n=1 Tax=Acanthopleuribacter pedis TaxID=442870 RepID=A0A8J7QBQ2_9BACT|nr:lysophospholipid acyltransferase family protein [Acanthopleuribacter pedis]MBO1321174.1 1-acyl-sn-glycerol-3-phosphate acyltransferase [Acanthopleuribacter pedis]
MNVRGVIAGLLFLPITILLSIAVCLARPFSRLAWPSKVMQLWANSVFWMSGIKLQVVGEEHLTAGKPAIYMANHASMIDIPILVAVLPGHVRFLFKHTLMYVPFLGQAMMLLGMIPINRTNRTKSVESLRKAGERIRSGIDVIIFPEGTRTKTGEMLPFKNGGFLMAIQEGFDIVPVTIHNSREVCGRNSIVTRKGVCRVTIHPRYETTGFTVADRRQIMSDVERIIGSAVQLRGRDNAAPVIELGHH